MTLKFFKNFKMFQQVHSRKKKGGFGAAFKVEGTCVRSDEERTLGDRTD